MKQYFEQFEEKLQTAEEKLDILSECTLQKVTEELLKSLKSVERLLQHLDRFLQAFICL